MGHAAAWLRAGPAGDTPGMPTSWPASWEPVVTPGGVWDPVTNNDPATGDWVELGDIEQTGGGNQIARDDGVKTMVGLIPTAKEYDFELKAAGVAWADLASPWHMHRINPLPFPKNWQYRCVTADAVLWNPNTVNRAADGQPASYKAVVPSPWLNLTQNGWDGNKAARLPVTNDYTRLKATMRFRQVNYAVLEDSEMDYTVSGVTYRLSEVYRNTEFFSSVDPILDLLMTGTTQFLQWADGPVGVVGTDLTAKMPEYVQRASFVAVWHAVPYEYIIAPGAYLPKKIMDGIGCVNSADWYGFKAGTLKLEAPRFKKSSQAAVRVIPGNFNANYVFDIFFPFSFIDPEPGMGGSSVFRGWNLSLYSSTGKWYSVKRKGSTGTPLPYLKPYDFNKLFEHVSS